MIDIKTAYNKYGTLKKAARELGITYKVARYQAKKQKVVINPAGRFVAKYSFNQNIFNEDTEESAYVAGFIWGDGCVYCHEAQEPNKLKITLSVKDKEHLIKIKEALKFSGPISHVMSKKTKSSGYKNNHEKVGLTIVSKQFVKTLERWNVFPKKSNNFIMPDWITTYSNRKHALRGFSDADGCFYIKTGFNRGRPRKPRFTHEIVGTKEALEVYYQIIKKDLNITKGKISHGHSQSDVNHFCLRYHLTEDAIKIHDYLYNNANIFLKRKFDKKEEFFKSLATYNLQVK